MEEAASASCQWGVRQVEQMKVGVINMYHWVAVGLLQDDWWFQEWQQDTVQAGRFVAKGHKIPLNLQKVAGRVWAGREKQKTQAVIEQCEQSWVRAKHSLQPL